MLSYYHLIVHFCSLFFFQQKILCLFFLLLFLLIFYLLSILKVFDSIGVSDNMSLSFVFLIGIVAAFSSCLAVTGGLLVSITAKYSELHPNLKGFQKFKPHLYFNIGRILGYTILGGVIGAFGSIFAISTTVTGILTIVASSIMIILGLDLLGLSPKFLSFLKPSSHKKLSHKIMQKSDESPSKGTPFFLGASTFFLPCGFTIALQLYVLSKADPMVGAITMFAFSLGTLPGLLSLGVLSSFLKGTSKRIFFKTAGVIVILLGILTIPNGLILSGLYASNSDDGVNEKIPPSVFAELIVMVGKGELSSRGAKDVLAMMLKGPTLPRQGWTLRCLKHLLSWLC